MKNSADGALHQDILLGTVILNQKLELYKTGGCTFKELKAMQDTDLKVSIGDTAHVAVFLLESLKLGFCPSVI